MSRKPGSHREQLDRTASSGRRAVLLAACTLLCACGAGCGSVRGTDAPLMQEDSAPRSAAGEQDAG